jgi:ubiquitin-conjugating enzyme E2 Z
MSAHPYENEPGHFASAKKEEPEPQAYIAKIRHETLRITVIQRLEMLLDIAHDKIPSLYKEVRRKTQALLDQANASGASGSSTTPSENGNGTETPDTEISVHEYDAEAAFASGSGVWDPFADLSKRRFLWYFDTYLKTIATYKTE